MNVVFTHQLLAICLLISPIFGAIDHYKVLGLNEKATEDEIKKSYRELAKVWHPDKNKNYPRAHEKFIEISEAYTTLSDATKRRIYDQTRRDGSMSFNRGQRQYGKRYHEFHFPQRRGYSEGRGFPQGGRGFHFEYTSNSNTFSMDANAPSILVYIAWLVNALMLALPLMCLCFPILSVYGIWRCCCQHAQRRTPPPTSGTPKNQPMSKQIPELSRTTLLHERRIVIVALSDASASLLGQIRLQFSRDPVYLCWASLPASTASPPPSLLLVAFCKKGTRYCSVENREVNESVLVKWIEAILNGEVTWRDATSMPHTLKPAVLC